MHKGRADQIPSVLDSALLGALPFRHLQECSEQPPGHGEGGYREGGRVSKGYEALWPQEGPICSERTRRLAGVVTPAYILHPRSSPGPVGC